MGSAGITADGFSSGTPRGQNAEREVPEPALLILVNLPDERANEREGEKETVGNSEFPSVPLVKFSRRVTP